ncbi:MAG: DNA primase [Verrucomicrobiaceae bacterium]|nr:DNA primase [Verrucomicrobiaceae bacterium]
MGRIPEETINQVLAATDIVALIGRSVKLRRAGTNFLGLCPFHNEKSPSFNVSAARGTYHCFGCGAGGSAIRFVMEHDGLSFVESVKRLADAAGIRIEEEVWDANAEAEAKHRALLLRAHKESAEWFHQLLLRHQLAAPARDYLKARGINAEMAKRWQMGYAPQSTVFYREWMAQKKLPENVMVEAGLFVQPGPDDDGRTNRPYARWRHRLMFPIRNDNGDVIGFSGRILDKDQKGGKYVNSPETGIFKKSNVLFGFDKSKRHIAKAGQAVICEGQIDMIMVFEAGVQNVVAGQGTAFTEQHAKMLKRLCNEVVLCYDSDNAGREAAEKAFRILSPQGLEVRVASLPAGEDPDSLIRKQGAEAFRGILESAPEFLEHQIRAMLGGTKSAGMAERVRMAERVAGAIAIFSGVAQRVTAVNKVAKLLEVPEEELNRMVTRAAREREKQPQKAEDAAQDAKPAESAQKLVAAQNKNALLLCQLALADAEVLVWLRAEPCEEILSEVPGTEMLALLWRSRYDPLQEIAQSAFMAGLERHEEAAFAQMVARPRPPGGLEEARQTLGTLEVVRLQSLAQRAQARLRQPGLNEAQMTRLQREVMDLNARLKEALDRLKGSPDSRAPAAHQ